MAVNLYCVVYMECTLTVQLPDSLHCVHIRVHKYSVLWQSSLLCNVQSRGTHLWYSISVMLQCCVHNRGSHFQYAVAIELIV